MKAFRLTILFIFIISLAHAQTYDVKGTVKDNTGMPLVGVSVVVKGTTRGASTDMDGNFAINKVEKGKVLEFSYIGYVTASLPVRSASPMNVVLKEDNQQLDEVVVIGYGLQKKKDVTGAVSLVGEETLTELKPVDASMALQGTTSGVSVNTASGSPGGNINILIRGVSSNGNNAPLVIVDGYEGA